jgi:hypothetical protein
MPSTFVVCVVMSVVVYGASMRQGGSEPKAGEPKKGDVLTVKGCLTGPTIEELSSLRTYRLTGDKALLKELAKEHTGHVDEVTGTLKSTLLQGSTRSKQVGKTRISIGVAESRTAPDRGDALPVLSVKSFQHLQGVCAK